MPVLKQQAIAAQTDLREMLRSHVVNRSLACMAAAAEYRTQAMASVEAGMAYGQAIRKAVHGFYGTLPVGTSVPRPSVTHVGASSHDGFRLENVLFETFPGWEVNATVYVPTQSVPPFPVVIVPVGHSGKQFANYQLPCQYFARAGYLAICFDPPGQAGEKQPGNDHFNDGVRDYLIGRTSSRHFIADAIRCIDYAATRSDVDLTPGVAMTGVSGGGVTTTFAALLDDRITVIGPCCCVDPLSDFDIMQCGPGCPETHPIRRYADGVDSIDLLCAGAPRPCLLMAGAEDPIHRVEDTRRLTEIVAGFYRAFDADRHFEFSLDSGGHAYPLTQARAFVRFMNRWLRHDLDRTVPGHHDAGFVLLPPEDLLCRPRTDVSMRTLAISEAASLRDGWNRDVTAIRKAAATVVGIRCPIVVPAAEMGEPFHVWGHDWRAVILRPEPGIELPATLLTAHTGIVAPTILHFDEEGRHRLLYRHGPLAFAGRLINQDSPPRHIFSVDLRGWGDSQPSMHPYDMAPWGGIDRYLAYASAALGDALMAMRTRDALAALAWLRTRREVDRHSVVLTGHGLGALVALHVAAIDGEIAGVVIWDGLSSFRSLLAADRYPWPAETFLPNVLLHYDLPELAAAIPCPVIAHNLRNGVGDAADETELAPWRKAVNVTLEPSTQAFCLETSVSMLIDRRGG